MGRVARMSDWNTHIFGKPTSSIRTGFFTIQNEVFFSPVSLLRSSSNTHCVYALELAKLCGAFLFRHFWNSSISFGPHIASSRFCKRYVSSMEIKWHFCRLFVRREFVDRFESIVIPADLHSELAASQQNYAKICPFTDENRTDVCAFQINRFPVRPPHPSSPQLGSSGTHATVDFNKATPKSPFYSETIQTNSAHA